VKSLIKAAAAAFDRGDFAAARHEAKRAVDKGGGAPALILLGDVYVQKGESETDAQRGKDAYQKAAARYADALKLTPQDPQIPKRQDLVRRLLSGLATDHPAPSTASAPVR